MFFQKCFEVLNNGHYFCMACSIERSVGYECWLKGLAQPLSKIDQTTYVTIRYLIF